MPTQVSHHKITLKMLAAFLLATLATSTSAGQWWEWGNATATGEYPLQVPSDMAAKATPIWHTTAAEFIFARTEFSVEAAAEGVGENSKVLLHAAAFVTAQQSPFCKPDERLITNDYGSCIPYVTGPRCVGVGGRRSTGWGPWGHSTPLHGRVGRGSI